MIFNEQELISRVRILLNEDAYDSGTEETDDTGRLTLDLLIKTVLDAEVRRLMDVTIFTGYDDVPELTGTIRAAGPGSGRLELPEDFRTLVELRVSGWQRPVQRALAPEDKGYERRTSPSAIVRGTDTDPMAYLIREPKKRYLEVHPFRAGDTLLCGRYCSAIVCPSEGNIFIPSRHADEILKAVAEQVKKIREQ